MENHFDLATAGPDAFEFAATEIEGKLGLPVGFVRDLLKEDDWSFVVKCHALLESTAIFALSRIFDADAIRPTLAKVDMSRRTDMLRDLDVLPPENLAAMRALSTLRNDVAHNIGRASFTFGDHLKQSKAVSRFINPFKFVWKKEAQDSLTRSQPKWTVWLAVVQALSYMNLAAELSHLKRENLRLKAEQVDWMEERHKRLDDVWGVLGRTLVDLASLPKDDPGAESVDGDERD